MLIHQLQGAFEAAYEKAAASSKPDDWMNAALFAKQFSNAHREAFQQHSEPMGDERSQQLAVFLRLAEVVQADAKETRDRYPAQSERVDQLAAFMKTACKWAAHPAPEAAHALSDESILAVAAALESARVFIRNGVALGYIRMPDADCPDPAHGTLPLIERAMTILTRSSAATSENEK
ncbi:hypothetical protein M3795_15095 [Ralstonia pickettii]|uniref:hypothetical protein n=1 Tax=Ralstonia pickettii TaxID=329 RepID=UPI00203B9A44|nr:hypothetical protein [Ralstonia pickettii]MCM3581807.1 hypothetical protein [Ralstonia pickettii]